ncbi:alpha/beta-hydrolase [Neocallimastix lanati (nom. inval.)]|jgi:hypothetical protein|uniref:Alpha/beta-hydrolase n=1 Tax=Neocallimastix californiae TaxID=1754190 RepID=A0A1Y2CJX4_9FUNG|nr:alpha/beta-hydrolase [Neocallimastix sp. JGI-2020a]ORY47154.1 alpha/beta-hydrolase [Neocallimastix californiae]|eukprot:ORY47154.1 alpha/beta-hydrolase [Neocallimastix californiae]
MKLNLYIFIISIFTTICSSSVIDDIKDYTVDVQNYLKVKNIKRDIKFNPTRTLDVYYKANEVNELKPVVIHIYGGTWYKGNKVKFNNIGSLLDENDYVAVLPNYGLFPTAVFEDMVYDVYTAINWTFNNIKQYGGDPNRVTIVGHSAGAHLIALTLFKSYLNMENNNEILKPFPVFERVVLLAGPYDFDDYSLIAKYFDKDISNSLLEKFVKVLFRTKTVSPHDIVASLPDNSISDSFNVKKFVFYYTAGDEKVPETSSRDLVDELNRVCDKINIQYIYNEKQYKHSEIVNGIRKGEELQENIYLSLLKL